jgi:hypothetical protein
MVAIAVALVALLWLGFTVFGGDAQVARVKELRDELFSEAGKSLTPDERKEKFKELRDTMGQLSPEQRKLAFADARQKREAELENYFKLSQSEKTQYLDQQIDRMESFRKKAAAGKGSGGGLGGNSSAAGVGSQAFGSNTGGGGGGGGKGWGGGKGMNTTEEGRKVRLDQSTPEQRARRDQFFKDMQARRTQRGLPPLSFGGR